MKLTLDVLMERHEVPLSSFEERCGQAYQVVQSAVGFELREHSLEGMDSEWQGVQVSRLTNGDAGEPFDLSRDLMLRSQVLKLWAQEHVFLLTLHHIAADG